jgi:hypothetical protein
MKSVVSSLALALALAGFAAAPAVAQAPSGQFDRNRYVSAAERPQPEFDPLPLRAGAFEIRSRLGLAVRSNDNIYAEASNTTEDVIIGATPELELKSTWSVHEISAGVRADHREYLDQGEESSTDFTGFLRGRLDVTREFWVGGSIDGGRITEQRYEPAARTGADLTEYDRADTALLAAFRRDRFQVEGRLGSASSDFDTAQSFRDVTETYAAGRASYAISPDVAVYVQGRVSDQDYDFVGSALNPSRDGRRTTGQIGLNFELAAPFRGDIAFGYVEEEKDALSRPDTNGMSVDGRLEWFPTQLTTLTFTGQRDIFDPGLVNSSTAYNTSFGVRIDHELRRNVLLFGEARSRSIDFQDIDRTDDQGEFGIGLGYKLNRRARLDLSYMMRTQDSSGLQAERDFDQNILSAALVIYP